MKAAPPARRMSCLGRLLLVVIGAAAAAVPVFLALGDDLVRQLLALVYPVDRYDLHDPDLLVTWRLLLAAAAGLGVCLVLVGLLGRLRRRVRAEAVAPDPLQALRDAVAAGDGLAVEAAAERAVDLGDVAVADLLGALEQAPDEAARRALAAALYRVGRVVTAEVSLHPR